MDYTDYLFKITSGPWLNPQYMKIWHKIVKEFGIASVKQLFLTLEANLHHLALSTDWTKHVDSAGTVGSASHIVIASSRGSAKHAIARKGAASMMVKVLPRLLVSKAARQAGGKKIPGILYPESSDLAKRSKSVAWRAVVESSTSVKKKNKNQATDCVSWER
ncbi:hypothetical protein J1N35_001807 [Gossypium stocksii]|uniref:Uncharacterized protein n=1 Tax=Gossypium stocksii TaxID=47602 RepID=A0A9D4AMS6_9ROSI|nr:hypothetical protein J1N35_001807 [Gossypium stocksii]